MSEEQHHENPDFEYEQEPEQQDDQYDDQQEAENYEDDQADAEEGFDGPEVEGEGINYEEYDPIHQQQQQHLQQDEEFQVQGEEHEQADEGQESQEIDHSQSIPSSNPQQNGFVAQSITSPIATRNQLVFLQGAQGLVLTHSRVGTVPYTGGDVQMEAYERTVIEYEPQERTVTVMVPVEKKVTDYRPVVQNVVLNSQVRPVQVVSPLVQSTLRVAPVTIPVTNTVTSTPSIYQSQIVTRPFIPVPQTQLVTVPQAKTVAPTQVKVVPGSLNASVLSVSSPKSVPSTVIGTHKPTGSLFFRPQVQTQLTQLVKPQTIQFGSPTFQTIPSSTLRSTIVNPTSTVFGRPTTSFVQTLPQRHSFSHPLLTQGTLPFSTIKRQAVVPVTSAAKQ